MNAAHIPLDLLDHIAAYPEPPVSRWRPASTVPASMRMSAPAKGPNPLTQARLDALRGKGPLTTEQIRGVWLRAGVAAGDAGTQPILSHYLKKGYVQRPVAGKGVSKGHTLSLWEVV